jgi:tRNA threonylcarbamoyl adenosine modification protein YeaZ
LVLVIDTSSARAGLAVIGPGSEVQAESILEAGRDMDLVGAVESICRPEALTAVAVALGPGSFTGLRAGVAYGLGLAMGRRIPLLGLDTLELCRARARGASRGLAEAGRGRVYHAAEGEDPRLDEVAVVPHDLPGVGWLRPATTQALLGAGVGLLDESELRGFGAAAAALLGRAPELGYGRVKLRYIQTWGTGL